MESFMNRPALSVAVLAIVVSLAGATIASASRPFDWAKLKRDPQTGEFTLKLRTVTGQEKPERLRIKAGGHTAEATNTRRGRWVLTDETRRGAAVIVALVERIESFGYAKLRAVGVYGPPCFAKFKVRFRLRDVNRRDEKARFLEATGCP
jgi:hypothetical protein